MGQSCRPLQSLNSLAQVSPRFHIAVFGFICRNFISMLQINTRAPVGAPHNHLKPVHAIWQNFLCLHKSEVINWISTSCSKDWRTQKVDSTRRSTKSSSIVTNICNKIGTWRLPGNEQGYHSQPAQECCGALVQIVLRQSLPSNLWALAPSTLQPVPSAAWGFHHSRLLGCSYQFAPI